MIVEETSYKIKIDALLNMKANPSFLLILSAITKDKDKLFCFEVVEELSNLGFMHWNPIAESKSLKYAELKK